MIPVTEVTDDYDDYAGELKTIDTSTKVCYENLFQSCAHQGRDFQTCNAKLLDPQLFFVGWLPHNLEELKWSLCKLPP